ncbi:hypothetical protein QE152_g3937 [Popillia japonica]|uniref:Uncharacterized protein n=1 Tax=Popillia japonica TaxID=7064 RepID=A0AAW1N409_POPJA
MPPSLRSNGDKNEDLISFMKSEEFTEIIDSIVNKQVKHLNEIINELKSEIQVLKESNIDLIRLLTKNKTHGEICGPQKLKTAEDLFVIYGSTNNTTIKGITAYAHYHVCKLEPEVTETQVITTIKGITAYAHYHVCKLEPEVTETQVISYLKEKNIIGAKCEKMESRRQYNDKIICINLRTYYNIILP